MGRLRASWIGPRHSGQPFAVALRGPERNRRFGRSSALARPHKIAIYRTELL
jgi:hypothetical protein